MKSHFEGNNYYEKIEEWEIRELSTKDGNKFIGVYIKTSDGEKRYALGGDGPIGWIDALLAATNAKVTNTKVTYQ